jgi:hypothetical protein
MEMSIMSQDDSKEKKKQDGISEHPKVSAFNITPHNTPKVINSHLTSSDGGEHWEEHPGLLSAIICVTKPEDSDPTIHATIGPIVKKVVSENDNQLSQKLHDCTHKLHGVKYHLDTIQKEVTKRVEEFKKNYTAGTGVSTEMKNPRLVYETEAFLYQVKSSLDLLVQALGSRIPPLVSMRTFSKKKIAGIEHAGGAVINALSSFGFPQLAELFEKHRCQWIQTLVPMRDTVTHYSQLKGFHCFIEEPFLGKGQITIHFPSMPTGERVDIYCENIYKNLLDLYATALNLMPDRKK